MTSLPNRQSVPESGQASAGSVAAEASEAAAAPEESLADAAAYSRRGAAHASRKDYRRALADFDRAVELEPREAGYLLQRADVYVEMGQTQPALNDLDKAIELKPDYPAARLARASYWISKHENAKAVEDLEAADRALPPEADLRYSLAIGYKHAAKPERSIGALDAWMSFHPVDVRYGDALNIRCEMRALDGRDLPKAMSDCDKALSRAKKGSEFSEQVLRNRALVRLRLGDYARSVKDFDAAIKIDAKDSWAIYGRGIDFAREKKSTESTADFALAKSLNPKIDEEFSRFGITE